MSTQPTPYIALLRGINVGGNHRIKMADLKACFEKMGFTDVITYIQSGNVLFKSQGTEEDLIHTIEQTLAKKFGYPIPVVVLSYHNLAQTVVTAPAGFGSDPDTYRYDVIFIKSPLTAKEALEKISTKEGVDQVSAGKHALYFSRLTAKATQSKLSKVITLPIYKNMTIRNWNTTTKLLALGKANS